MWGGACPGCNIKGETPWAWGWTCPGDKCGWCRQLHWASWFWWWSFCCWFLLDWFSRNCLIDSTLDFLICSTFSSTKLSSWLNGIDIVEAALELVRVRERDRPLESARQRIKQLTNYHKEFLLEQKHSVWKSQKKYHCELRLRFMWTKKSSKMPIAKKWSILASFWKSEKSLRSNNDTRQVNLNWTKISGKCHNWKIQMRHFESFSNIVRALEHDL